MVGAGVGGGVLPDGVVGVSVGVVDAGLDGVLLGVVAGLVPEVGPAVPLGWAEGLVDAFLLGVASWLPDTPGFAAAPGLVAPPAGWELRAEPADELGDGSRPRVGWPVAGVVAGCWFAVGAPVNAPETSSATRPALARTPALTARAADLRRCGGFGWPASVGSDMRGGTFHSSDR